MERKILSFLLVGFLVVGLTGCGSSKDDETINKLKLTEKNLEVLENKVITKLEKVGYEDINTMYKQQILTYANNRVSAGSQDSKDVKKYTSVELSSYDLEDDYNFKVYGVLTGKDEYNSDVQKQFYISFYCTDDGNGNCEVSTGGLSISNN